MLRVRNPAVAGWPHIVLVAPPEYAQTRRDLEVLDWYAAILGNTLKQVVHTAALSSLN